jgi:hypothetical protein
VLAVIRQAKVPLRMAQGREQSAVQQPQPVTLISIDFHVCLNNLSACLSEIRCSFTA